MLDARQGLSTDISRAYRYKPGVIMAKSRDMSGRVLAPGWRGGGRAG